VGESGPGSRPAPPLLGHRDSGRFNGAEQVTGGRQQEAIPVRAAVTFELVPAVARTQRGEGGYYYTIGEEGE